MNYFQFLTADSIPQRPATATEALRLMGEGWGSIFIVIIIIMLSMYALNRLFRNKSDQ